MSAYFLQIRAQIEHDVQNIYDNINAQLSKVYSNDIAATLIRLETEKVNIYITDMVAKVRIVAIEELKQRAYAEYLTAGAWTKIIKSVGMPKIKLCSIQQINNAGYSNHTQTHHASGKDAKNKEQIAHLENRKIASIGAAGLGGTAVVAALIIPGWEALPITLLCAGGIVLVCGSVSAITSQREIETIKSRMEKEQIKATQSHPSAPTFTKKLTDFQAQNNIEVIARWLDKIEEAIDNLCNSENA